ncbi:MAG: TonB-dependent receptor, partial [Chitinophagaceae bacterium]
MKRIFNTLIAIVLGSTSMAQSSADLVGSAAGIDGPLAGSTVSLLKTDSSELKTVVADQKGDFKFSGVPEGDYLLRVNAKGHQEVYSAVQKVNGISPVNAGTLVANPATRNLQAVVVTSKKPMIEVKADKTVMNVDAMISNTGAYALEVLEKAPGVTVDKDGNISLKGKQGVVVLIDGKQTYLSGNELANYLRNMPASNLDQIEIMTNPSAKYDAAGNSGVINIKTKKQKQKGFNGSANLAYGQSFYHR